MFRPIHRDRRAIPALLGLLVCGAYVVGSLAVATSLADAAGKRTSHRASPGLLAWPGEEPTDPYAGEIPSDPALQLYRVGLVDTSAGRLVAAAVLRGPELPAGGIAPHSLTKALGPVAIENATLPAGAVPRGVPETWIWLDAETLARLVPGGAGLVAFAPHGAGAAVPAGWTATEASGVETFGREGLAEASRAALVLAIATSAVVIVLARSFIMVTVSSRADDLLLLHALGASRRRLVRMVLLWSFRLSALGIAVGALLGYGIVALAGSAAGAFGVSVSLAPRIEPAEAALTLGILLLAALLGSASGASRSVRRLFAPALPESRVAAGLAVALVVAVFVGSHLVIASALGADWLYAGEVVSLSASPIPSHSSLPVAFASDLVASGAARHAVPQVVAFTTLDGDPATIRGADPAALVAHHGGKLRAGKFPSGLDEVAVGAGLAERAGLAIGDRVALSPTVRPGLHVAMVVGVFEAQGLLRDEAVVALPFGRLLADVDAGTAHVIEVDVRDPRLLRDFVASLGLPPLRVLVPSDPVDGAFEIRVRNASRIPVAGAVVTAGGHVARTDVEGVARLVLPPGEHRLVVHAEGHRLAIGLVTVVAPAPPPAEAPLVILPADPPPSTNRPWPRTPPGGDPSAPGGGAPGGGDPGAGAPPGPANDTGFREVFQIESGTRAHVGEIAADDPLASVFGNLLGAILSIVLLSTLLLAVGIGSIWGRHVWERRPDLALLASLGASVGRIRRLLALRILADGGLALLVGVALGILFAHAYASLVPLVFFGHTLPFVVRIEPLLVTVPLALGALGVAALVGSRGALRRAPHGRVQRTPEAS